ncbi:transcriptional activator RfaH [Thioalkalivibrio denitrificans]|uniref:Transcriptional activator RfaH n=1 Tax=Thioalkalivibrio denitrificans TaxID=108003 RepID=A0A1V3N7M0_9GAMM|nr:transcription/translation regulatory transformer protein RfaH [Thioalkalivibrio denitrificans]OOG20796.1 transcriptional activator RfaH [Thioalkalivibrio denitrificans]
MSRHWYLVQCKPRESFRAEEHLNNQGFETFHPTHLVHTRVAGRRVRKPAPLFPHYLFVCLDAADNWSSLRSTRGVARIVRFGNEPRPVPPDVIEALKAACATMATARPAFRAGERVRIAEGCFAECEAIVQQMRGEDRVLLLLEFLGRQQAVEIAADLVTKPT